MILLGALVVYLGMALIGLDRAGRIDLLADSTSTVAMWVVAGLLGLGVPMNLASRSRPERLVMTPVVVVLTGVAMLIAGG